MAVVTMQSEKALQRKADQLQELMVKTLSAVLRRATQELGASLTAAADSPSDPAWRRAETEWMSAVSGEFFPRVVEAYASAAEDVHLQLVDLYEGPAENVPFVSNEAARLYLIDTANRMVATTEGTWARARGQLIEGFSAGESIEELSARLTSVTDWSTSRAATVARTEIISASNAGALAEVRSVNPDASKEWVATKDSRTREWHREANGETVLLDGTFTVGGEELDFPGDPDGRPDNIINCVIGSTLVDASRIKVVMRSWFDGEIFDIRTSAGKTLSVTPNHPILTLTGWKDACDLQMGDDVICGDLRHGVGTKSDEQRGPTEISEIYRAASVTRCTQGVCETPADFHGERRNADIHVVSQDGLLGVDGQTSSPEDLDKFVFTATYAAHSTLGGVSDCVIPLTSDGTLRSEARSPSDIGGRCTNPTCIGVDCCAQDSIHFCLGSQDSSRVSQNTLNNVAIQPQISGDGEDKVSSIMPANDFRSVDRRSEVSGDTRLSRDTSVSEMFSQNLGRDAHLESNLHDGESLMVSTDRIIEIVRRSFRGHVYNLATGSGWYLAHGITLANCRCTMAFHVPKNSLNAAVNELSELPDVTDEFDPSDFMDFEFLEASATPDEHVFFDESKVRRAVDGKFMKRDLDDVDIAIREGGETSAITVAPAKSLVEVLQSSMPADLKDYWLRGPGAAEIGWGTTGSFRRCVSNLREHFPLNTEGLCANLYHEATGHWPGEKREK